MLINFIYIHKEGTNNFSIKNTLHFVDTSSSLNIYFKLKNALEIHDFVTRF